MELLENYRLVDLTVPIKTPNLEEMDPKLATSLAAEIEYLDHEDTIPLVSGYFGCRPEDLHGGAAGPQSVSGPPPMRGHMWMRHGIMLPLPAVSPPAGLTSAP